MKSKYVRRKIPRVSPAMEDPLGRPVITGDVAVHNDGQRHVAIVLDANDRDCNALFFTSSPNWASHSRRATADELALSGYVSHKHTFLAYVRRPAWEFSPTGASFPDYRIAELKREFKPAGRLILIEV